MKINLQSYPSRLKMRTAGEPQRFFVCSLGPEVQVGSGEGEMAHERSVLSLEQRGYHQVMPCAWAVLARGGLGMKVSTAFFFSLGNLN